MTVTQAATAFDVVIGIGAVETPSSFSSAPREATGTGTGALDWGLRIGWGGGALGVDVEGAQRARSSCNGGVGLWDVSGHGLLVVCVFIYFVLNTSDTPPPLRKRCTTPNPHD